MEFTECSFEGNSVTIDGNRFVRCVFRNCEIVYGGGLFYLDHCEFHDLRFRFEGAAAQTVQLLTMLRRVGHGSTLFDSVAPPDETNSSFH